MKEFETNLFDLFKCYYYSESHIADSSFGINFRDSLLDLMDNFSEYSSVKVTIEVL